TTMMLIEIPRRGRGRSRYASTARWIEALEDRVLLSDGIQASPAPQINGTAGVLLSNVEVASYTITDSSGNPGTQWRGKVDWGDNSAIDKKISPTAEP